MVYLYFAWVECFPTVCTCRSIVKNNFFSQVHPSWSVFMTVPDRVGEKVFSLNAILFLSHFVFLGVGVVPFLA